MIAIRPYSPTLNAAVKIVFVDQWKSQQRNR